VAVSAMPQNNLYQVQQSANQVKRTNRHIKNERGSLNQNRRQLDWFKKQAKVSDTRADKIDARVAKGRLNGMSQEKLNSLNRQRGSLRNQETKMKRRASTERTQISQDKNDLKHWNGVKNQQKAQLQQAVSNF
jgi:chromosome segregation ATPase